MIGLSITLVILLIATLLSSAKAVGMAVKMGIESCDKTYLGVDITVGKANLSICEGYVNVAKLVVHNPEGREWKSKYLMRIDQMVVKIALCRLIRSKGNEFEITTC